MQTGVDLKLPHDVTKRVFNQYTTLFNEKNYMEGLNRIIDEIGELMIDPFQVFAPSPCTRNMRGR